MFLVEWVTDTSNGKTYSVLETILSLDKNLIHSDSSFASIVVFQKALSGYITMFIPIIVAFPFMVSFCAERNNGLMRFTITRIGKYRYYFSKFFASFLSGGLAVLLGVALLGISTAFLFPSISSYNVSAEDMTLLLNASETAIIVKMLSAAFLLGAVSTMPAFFLSSFCRNPYLITCLPFMLEYVWDTVMSKITLNAIETNNTELCTNISPFLPNSIMNLAYWTEFGKIEQRTVIFNVCYVAVMFFGFILVMNMRKDSGN